MPPKPKFTKEEIVAAALELVSREGLQALTARELGARLGSSARPIFTVFSSMQEVQEAVREAALARFWSFSEKALHYTPAFKQVGMQMILFAMEEPKLYQLLYMSESPGGAGFEAVFSRLGQMGPVCVEVIRRDYGLTQQEAMGLFQHVWIHTFAIGALCATGMCRFTPEEIGEQLGQDFLAMLAFIKGGGLTRPTPVPREESHAQLP